MLSHFPCGFHILLQKGIQGGNDMRRLIAFTFFLLIAIGTAFPKDPADKESKPNQPRNWGNGYLEYGGSFFTNRSLKAGGNFGLGIDVRIWRGLVIGGEIGAITSGGDGIPTASANGTYQFMRTSLHSKRMVPFVTGGYTVGSSGDGSIAGGNVGGGITWWFHKRLGLRMEVRDFFFRDAFNCIGVRAGISFR
jgi:hypothetical protein